jgi:hypothetical protein
LKAAVWIIKITPTLPMDDALEQQGHAAGNETKKAILQMQYGFPGKNYN